MSDEPFGGATTRTEHPDVLDVCPSSPPVSPRSPASTCTCMYRRILLIVAIVVCLVLGVYFKHFHRLPTEDILAANLARLGAAAEEEYYYDDEIGESDARRSQHDWDQWIRSNRFVSIGKLFDKCGKIPHTGGTGGGNSPQESKIGRAPKTEGCMMEGSIPYVLLELLLNDKL